MNNIWFKGSCKINCSIQTVQDSLNNIGEHYEQVIRLMPGISECDLIKETSDTISIKTNEGVMSRSNIIIKKNDTWIDIEYHKEYTAGKTMTSKSQINERFEIDDNCTSYHLTISNVKASGILGFFYRLFGKNNIGKALMNSHKTYLEGIQ